MDWDYDSVGNRTKENSNNYSYFANSNKLSLANGKSYGYDANGNTTDENSRIFGYNDNQRLVSVSDAGTTYTYNGNGQRVKKVGASGTTIFHYNLNGQIIAESNSAGTITAEYVYLNGQPLAKLEGTNTYYYHNDHLGTPQKMTDASGVVRWSADYKPFGEVNITTNDITNNHRFPGQYYDAETGLNYNYYRDYNPAIGRYIEKDPIGILRGRNHLYAYTGNKPVNYSDRYGLKGGRPMPGFGNQFNHELLDNISEGLEFIQDYTGVDGKPHKLKKICLGKIICPKETPHPVPLPLPKICEIKKPQEPQIEKLNNCYCNGPEMIVDTLNP